MNIVLPNRFEPRDYQANVIRYLQEGGLRCYLRWHRRSGKDLLATNIVAYLGVQRPGLYWHVLPTYTQGKKVAWQGQTAEGRPFLDAFPKNIRVGTPNEAELKLKFRSKPDPVTGEERTSTYQVVGGDNFDTLVGTGAVGIIFSEWSLMNPKAWDYFKPILKENKGWAIFIFTPRGRNHAYRMEQTVKKHPRWLVDKKTVKDTGYISEEELEEDRKEGYTEEKIQSEYFVNYEALVEGCVYAEKVQWLEKEGRFTSDRTWNPKYPVNTCWDLGVDNFTFIWFYQKIEGNYYFIDTYYNSGVGIAHYSKILNGKPYVYRDHFGPWDVSVRNFDEEAKTRKEIFRENGVNIVAAPQRSVEDGIEKVASKLPLCWFNPDGTQYGIDCLKAYHRKEVEGETFSLADGTKKQVYGKPVGDWASHACDALRSWVLCDSDEFDSGTFAPSVEKLLAQEAKENSQYNELDY